VRLYLVTASSTDYRLPFLIPLLAQPRTPRHRFVDHLYVAYVISI